jgi:hypothetical protein
MVAVGSSPMEPRPLPQPEKLLEIWMTWENGEETPGRVMANLKTAGMRELLDGLVAAQAGEASAAG